MMFVSSACLYCEHLNVTTIKKKAVSQLFALNLSRALRTFFFTSVMIHTHKTPVCIYSTIPDKGVRNIKQKRYKNKFITEMTFPKLPRQLQEETVFPGELKRFRYEEVPSLSFIGKRKCFRF